MNQSCFISSLFGAAVQREAAWIYKLQEGEKKRKKKKHPGSDGLEEDKGGSLSAGASPSNPCCSARRQRKALSQGAECISEEVNSCYLNITWRHRTADGRAFYIGEASLSHQYLVTANPAATSDSFLSFAGALSPCTITPVLVLERPSAYKCLSMVPSVLDPHLVLPGACVCCVCVWISNGGWHCVCRGKG